MNDHTLPSASQLTPAQILDLLNVVARHDVDDELVDLERALAQVRANVEAAAAARRALSQAPVENLRAALRARGER